MKIWDWLFHKEKEKLAESEKKRKILLGTLIPISLITIASSIFLGCWFGIRQTTKSFDDFDMKNKNALPQKGIPIDYAKYDFDLRITLQITNVNLKWTLLNSNCGAFLTLTPWGNFVLLPG